MLLLLTRISWVVILCLLSAVSIPVLADDLLTQQRQDFLFAEKLLKQHDDAAFWQIAGRLTTYPLYPYLEYQWLQNNLPLTDKIQAFLLQYGDTRYAALLREKWLRYLAEHEQWPDFIRHYQASDNEELVCHYDWALYQTGQIQQAFNHAKPLWLKGLSQPKACERLWLAFALSPELTPDWLWQRFEAALANDNVSLAVFLQRYFQPMDKLIAADWLKFHSKPALLAQQQGELSNPLTARMVANALRRWLKTDLDAELWYWETHKSALALTETLKNELDNQVALALAVKQDPRALWRMQQLTNPDAKTAEWKIRLALALQNWSMVQQGITQLPSSEQQQPVWRYWQARATEALGNVFFAQQQYQQLAEDRSFYGFLAADKVGKPYQMADKPVSASFSDLEQLANTTDFKVVREFSALNRDIEARRQWWFALTKLSPAQIQIAAKLAQSWQWPQIAIMTLVKADYWDDLKLRFPFKYQTEVLTHAKQHGLEPALIYGVMRQESMLDSQALSAAGAIGLMQVMPTTGQQIARELGQNIRVTELYLAERNIQLGSYYVNKLIKRFSGQIAPAIAAYNAGPERVKRWLSEEKAIPVDIWIETIPFKETRKYVTSVLAYALIYQYLLQTAELSDGTMKLSQLLLDTQAAKN